MATKKKRSENNTHPIPKAEIALEYEGPSFEYLLDTKEIYEQVIYKEVHANMEEWECVKER